MDSDQITKRRGRPPKRDDGDGQVGSGSVGAGIENAALEKSVVTWLDMQGLLEKAQSDNFEKRIVRVWHMDATVEMYFGPFGNAPIERGEPAYQFNTGEIIAI